MRSRTAANPKLQKILREVSHLRPLPASVTRLVRALENPTVTGGEVGELLSLDQALTAQVLRMANSAYLGYGPACSTVAEAVMRLGFNRIKTLVLGATTSSMLNRRLAGYGLAGEELWRHSVVTASLARHVAGSLHYADLDEAYVAGLLHDIGKLVLDQYVRVDYHAIVELMKKRKLQLWQVEEHLFGMDHGAVGGLMAANWNFPPALTEAIKCHHWPTLARTRPELAAIINLANALALEHNAGLTTLGGASIHPEGLRLLGLDDQRLGRLRASLSPLTAEAEVAAGGSRR